MISGVFNATPRYLSYIRQALLFVTVHLLALVVTHRRFTIIAPEPTTFCRTPRQISQNLIDGALSGHISRARRWPSQIIPSEGDSWQRRQFHEGRESFQISRPEHGDTVAPTANESAFDQRLDLRITARAFIQNRV